MKTLLVIRHAKSSRNDPSLRDMDRPLAKRGKRDAPEMGKRLARHGVRPDRIVSSPAARAVATARLIARELDYPEKDIQVEEDLYAADAEDWIGVARRLDSRDDCVAMVGHNPAIDNLIAILAPQLGDHAPTCAAIEIVANIAKWSAFAPGKVEVVDFDYPKKSED